MKLPTSRLASATRSLSARATSSRIAPTPTVLQRCFHPTPSAQLPRRRTFFTSNVLLQADGSAPSPTQRDGEKTEKAQRDGEKRPSAASPSRPSGQYTQGKKRNGPLKNSLHRVAIVAQKGGNPSLQPSHATGGGLKPIAPSEPNDGSTTISAICVANSFDMDQVVSILSHHGFAIDPDGTGFDQDDVVHARGLNQGDIFVFASGTVVTWALPADVADTLATKTLLPAAENPAVAEKEVEDLDFALDNKAEKTLVKEDGVVVLGTKLESDREITLNKIAISSGLARSTKLGMLESSLERYLESTRPIPDQLSAGLEAHGPLSRELILQKTGELLNLRSQLNHYNELTDALPDMLWDSEARLETYYGDIGKALNVGFRITTLNTKLTYAQEVVKAAQEVVNIAERASSEKHGTRLEWIIIILIAVEVGFELRRLYKEYTEEDKEEAMLAEIQKVRGLLETVKPTGEIKI